MTSFDALERARRGTIRWRILYALNMVYHRPIGEPLLLQVLHDALLPVTGQELRDQLKYLEGKGLVAINPGFENQWQISITSTGVDVAEYEVECPAGIDRPLKG